MYGLFRAYRDVGFQCVMPLFSLFSFSALRIVPSPVWAKRKETKRTLVHQKRKRDSDAGPGVGSGWRRTLKISRGRAENGTPPEKVRQGEERDTPKVHLLHGQVRIDIIMALAPI